MNLRPLTAVLMLAILLAIPTAATAHPERPAYFPNFNTGTKTFEAAFGAPPEYRRSGPVKVVCKPDSKERLIKSYGKERKLRKYTKGRKYSKRKNKRIAKHNKRVRKSQKDLRTRLKLLKQCKFEHIQAAVNAAQSNDRVLVMPGVYREEPSRANPEPDPKCKGDYVDDPRGAGATNPGGIATETTDGPNQVPSYEYHLNCPNAQNLIAVLGDGPDADRACDQRCNLQIEGMGKNPEDVYILGERSKLNVIRADRADGIYLRNFKVEFSDFNNLYVLETNGFRFDKVVSGYSREYGFLSFASDQGIYENLDAYGSGDSGIYPGSGPEGHCGRYGIEIRKVESHDNNLGYSGTAGNGVWVHDSKFFNNGTGMVTDSFAAGHPGMPQDCAKWENNEIYSNNFDILGKERQEYCDQPIEKRDPKKVCSTFQNPTGTGVLIAGGNGNIVRNNHIYDNWRNGVMLHWVPAELRGDDKTGQSVNTPDQFDTSNKNSIRDNKVGVRPDGTRDPNGTDFWWDEQGIGNCWDGNTAAGGGKVSSDPATLPDCKGTGSSNRTGNQGKQAFLVPCATWDPK
ncbi:MAG: hypothetical protein H0V29_02780, partial [Thermoleophilaceae bacterium]|nr:hypothetical protein [Thermoleophilaceae bacterium]